MPRSDQRPKARRAKLDAINAAALRAAHHAATCRACYLPIIDDEGNPGLFGECCADGRALLVAYCDSLGEMVPEWARKDESRYIVECRVLTPDASMTSACDVRAVSEAEASALAVEINKASHPAVERVTVLRVRRV